MISLAEADRRWLDSAARLARPWLGTTGESPTVGALIVDENRQLLLGRGTTTRGGGTHAEMAAIAEARAGAAGQTLYVTTEPRTAWGRTPPATDAIIQAGLGRVVVGMLDPDAGRAGQGLRQLAAAGIETVLADHAASRSLGEAYAMRIRRNRPFITARLAVSRDGRIGLPDQGNFPISGDAARRWTHMQRAFADAVMVGARTAELDDPRLTVELKGLENRPHLRVILGGKRSFRTNLNLIEGVSGYPTAIIAEAGRPPTVPSAVEIIEVEGRNGRPDLRKSLAALAQRGINHLFVESGARLTEALIAGELVDRFHLITSEIEIGRQGVPATMLGGIEGRLTAAGFVEVERRSLGSDLLRTLEREV